MAITQTILVVSGVRQLPYQGLNNIQNIPSVHPVNDIYSQKNPNRQNKKPSKTKPEHHTPLKKTNHNNRRKKKKKDPNKTKQINKKKSYTKIPQTHTTKTTL